MELRASELLLLGKPRRQALDLCKRTMKVGCVEERKSEIKQAFIGTLFCMLYFLIGTGQLACDYFSYPIFPAA